MMRIISIVSFIGIFAITIGGRMVNASETFDLSLDQAIELAITTSENLLIKKNNTKISDAIYRQEKSVLYPQVSSSFSWNHNAEYPEALKTTRDDYSMNSGIAVEQLLWSFGKVSSSLSAANNYLAVNQYNEDSVYFDVIYLTKVSYFNVSLAQKMYSIREDSYQNSLKNREILEGRSADGRISRRDNIKMSADVASRVPLVNAASSQLENARQTLGTIIGVRKGQNFNLLDEGMSEYSPLIADELLAIVNENEPSLKMLEQDVELSKNILKVNKAKYFPEIYAFGTWDYNGSGNSGYVGENQFDEYGVVGVKFSLPIWTGGKTKYQIREAVLNVENSQLLLKQTQENLEDDVRNTIASYNNYVQTLKANNEAVKLSQESYQVSQDLFSSGQLSLTDLNDAELALTQEKLSFENTIYQLNVLMAKIERLTAVRRMP